MERSRFITIALVILSAISVLHAKDLVGVTYIQLLILCAIAAGAHISSWLCSRNKFLHAVSPLVSFFLLIETLLILNANGDIGKMLPHPSALSTLFHDVRNGVVAIRDSGFPVKYSVEVFLVFAVLMWVVAEIGETLAQRLHSSGPTLTWYVLVNAVIAAQHGAKFLTVSIIVLCAGSWFFLYAFDRESQLDRAHLISIPREASIGNLTRHAVTFLIIILVSLFLVLPVSGLPSYAPKNFFKFLSSSQNQTELSPLVSMKEQLTSPTRQVMFTATSNEIQYWRVSVLDDFDGDTWSITSQDKQKPEQAPAGIATHRVDASVSLVSLAPKFLPSIYSTQSVTSRDVTFLKGSVLFASNSKTNTYSIQADVPPSTLDEAQAAKSSDETPKSVESSILLPTDFDKTIIAKAVSIAQNKESIYAQVMALRNFFLDGSFVYDTTVNYSSDTHAMRTFLEKKRGFCEQFATTYAAMARSIGIPARVVVGFSPGTPDANGRFTITNQQAHSWVEVYLSNFGWLTVDPTPPGELPGQAPNNIGVPVTTTTTTTQATVAPTSVPITTTTTPAQQHKATHATSLNKGNILAFVLILLAGTSVGIIILKRRNKLRGKTDVAYVVNTFREISEKVLDVSHPPDLTISELEHKVPENNKVVIEFLQLLALASYAPDDTVSLRELKSAAAKARSEKIIIRKK
jgi:transglutaminase-like putative cysteine protease